MRTSITIKIIVKMMHNQEIKDHSLEKLEKRKTYPLITKFNTIKTQTNIIQENKLATFFTQTSFMFASNASRK